MRDNTLEIERLSPAAWRWHMYGAVVYHCLKRGMFPTRFFYANLAYLDPSLGLYSKQKINDTIPAQWQLKSVALPMEKSARSWFQLISKEIAFPLFLKPEWGENSLGIYHIHNARTLKSVLKKIKGGNLPYLCQEAAPSGKEYDLFYVKSDDPARDLSCTQLLAPEIVGDGERSISELVEERFPHYKQKIAILTTASPHQVLPKKTVMRLSFVNGIHEGTQYQDETEKLSAKDKTTLINTIEQIGQFGVGRVGVIARDRAALIAGDFKVVEINLYTPFPLPILDPRLDKPAQVKHIWSYAKTFATMAKQEKATASWPFLRTVYMAWQTRQWRGRAKRQS